MALKAPRKRKSVRSTAMLWEGWGIASPQGEVVEGFKSVEYATMLLGQRPRKYKLVRMIAFLQPVKVLRLQRRGEALKPVVDKVRK